MIALTGITGVAIDGRAVLIFGPSGSGKSSLALTLIDRGAQLIGDDGIVLHSTQGQLIADPPEQITGLLEVRNLGLLHFPVATTTPVALAITLDAAAPRFIEGPGQTIMSDIALPAVQLWPGDPLNALKVELALAHFGLNPG